MSYNCLTLGQLGSSIFWVLNFIWKAQNIIIWCEPAHKPLSKSKDH